MISHETPERNPERDGRTYHGRPAHQCARCPHEDHNLDIGGSCSLCDCYDLNRAD